MVRRPYKRVTRREMVFAFGAGIVRHHLVVTL